MPTPKGLLRIILPLLVSGILGCFHPEKFQATFLLKNNWDYEFSYEGTIIIPKQLRKGRFLELYPKIVQSLRSTPGTKYLRKISTYRYEIQFEKKGNLITDDQEPGLMQTEITDSSVRIFLNPSESGKDLGNPTGTLTIKSERAIMRSSGLTGDGRSLVWSTQGKMRPFEIILARQSGAGAKQKAKESVVLNKAKPKTQIYTLKALPENYAQVCAEYSKLQKSGLNVKAKRLATEYRRNNFTDFLPPSGEERIYRFTNTAGWWPIFDRPTNTLQFRDLGLFRQSKARRVALIAVESEHLSPHKNDQAKWESVLLQYFSVPKNNTVSFEISDILPTKKDENVWAITEVVVRTYVSEDAQSVLTDCFYRERPWGAWGSDTIASDEIFFVESGTIVNFKLEKVKNPLRAGNEEQDSAEPEGETPTNN